MQTHASIVVVGAGIAGASIAYHLAQLGRRDVVVLERGPLVGGTTSHAPGLVGQLRTSRALAQMLMYSVSLYRKLRLDGQAGYLGEGSLRLASSQGRWEQIHRLAQLAREIQLEAHLLAPGETARMFPLIDLNDVKGSLYLPHDGSAVATVLAGAMIRDAQAQGVAFRSHTRVEAVEVTDGQVRAVRTNQGRIETDTMVIAAGIWSPLVGRLAGVSIPLTPMQHQYVITEPLAELGPPAIPDRPTPEPAPLPERDGGKRSADSWVADDARESGSPIPLREGGRRYLPNLRDPDHLFYLRQREQSLVIGGYERTPRPFAVEAIPERPADPTVLAFDPAQLEPILQGATRRLPRLKGVGFTKQVNGLESFTPDGEFLLGPAPEVRGVWAACGFCAHGVSGAGGVGKVMAEWIVNGDPGMDLSSMALSRFQGRTLTQAQIEEQASQVYATYYDIGS